jgi:hypothetical protein
MPEVAVDEDRDPLLAEDDVRAARKIVCLQPEAEVPRPEFLANT